MQSIGMWYEEIGEVVKSVAVCVMLHLVVHFSKHWLVNVDVELPACYH